MSLHVQYGFFCGGDPRHFTPDEESCDAKEIAAWNEACAMWDRADAEGLTLQDELEAFARAGGWTFDADELHWHTPECGSARPCDNGPHVDCPPDFAHNLEACFDVLERFCAKEAWSIHKYFDNDITYYSLQLMGSVDHGPACEQLQAAIVRAMNAAAKART